MWRWRSGRLTTKNFLKRLWDGACENGPSAPAFARLLAPVMLTPTIAAQSRRSASQERREALEEQKALTVESTLVAGPGVAKRPRGSGMVVLEVPPNKARPHMTQRKEVEPGDASGR